MLRLLQYLGSDQWVLLTDGIVHPRKNHLEYDTEAAH